MKASNNNIQETIVQIGKQARVSAAKLSIASSKEKNAALQAIFDSLQASRATILAANREDVTTSRRFEASAAFIDRLTLTPERFDSMLEGIKTIQSLPDPVGRTLATFERPNGLMIKRISVPIGVIGVIYESRPNVTVDAAALCLKSGNAVILRGGSESFHTCQALLLGMQAGLAKTSLPPNCIQMLPTADRAAISEMLKLEKYIDVIVPRGGQKLIERLTAESRIPLFKHLAGLCHTYVHSEADKEMAIEIIVNAKMRRPGICGATETLLIDESIALDFLPDIFHALKKVGCEIRIDKSLVNYFSDLKVAVPQDFDTEFLDAIIAVKPVVDLNAAIQHITEHGTQHTEAIITENKLVAQQFLQQVDSAIVMHNASTQFADGSEFGMGAEIGIATGKLHARGPVGVEQLTTFKYVVHGNGQVR